ncbi:recombinase family protein [Streptomyces sp. NPDC056638]|uniref:recombinase family protein n=1 Tax=Streptomyces sp. NPDC056638 TaxID=3345887 RepID=UPI003684B183
MRLRPDEAEALRQAAARVIKKQKLAEVARWMNAQGYTGSRGAPWSSMSLGRLLDNPKIAGLAPDENGNLVPTGLAYVITPEEFHQLQGRERRSKDRAPEYDYLLTSGLSQCGLCHHDLVGARANNSTPGYRCLHASGGGCGKVRITADQLEDYVGTYVVAQLVRPGAQEQLIALRDQMTKQAEDLEKQIKALEERRERLAAVYVDQAITQADYDEGKKESGNKLRVLRKKLRFTQQAANAPVAGVTDLVAWWNTAPNESKRSLVVLLLEKIEVFQASAAGIRTVEPGRVKLHWRGQGSQSPESA